MLESTPHKFRGKDISGIKFNRATPIKLLYKDSKGQWIWETKCDCGNIFEAKGTHLIRGTVQSCGCLQKETRRLGPEARKTHGDAQNQNSPYKTWTNMISRCYNHNASKFEFYGGKGIRVCEEWHDYIKFRAWVLIHGWHKNFTISRIDHEKGYTPENCEVLFKPEHNKKDSHKKGRRVDGTYS